MKPGASIWILVVLITAPLVADAATIRGTLRIGRPKRGVVLASATPRTPASARLEQLSDAVVYLERAPEKVEKKLAKNPSPAPIIGQFDHSFIPQTTPVAVGTKVSFENQDRIYHNVFSISAAKRFDLGKLPPRQSREVVFDRPGVVQLFNDLDPTMAGFVLVLPHHLFTRPDSTGAWSFPKLPSGSYRVCVWHPRLGKMTRRVEIPKRGDAVLSLSY